MVRYSDVSVRQTRASDSTCATWRYNPDVERNRGQICGASCFSLHFALPRRVTCTDILRYNTWTSFSNPRPLKPDVRDDEKKARRMESRIQCR